MRPVWLTLVLAAGRGRAALVAGATAVATGLLLVAVSIARLPWGSADYGGEPGQDRLIGPIAETGTRGGAILGVTLLALPLLLLLDQAVRLGSGARERRYAALAVAGATRSDRRRWGALEVGLPAGVGAVLGVAVWSVLRLLLGTSLNGAGIALVPTDTGPSWWGVAVVVAIALFGVLVGVRQGSREAAVLPAAASPRRPPRVWPALMLAAAAALAVLSQLSSTRNGDFWALVATLSTPAAVVLAVGGLAGLSPWLAQVTARMLRPRVSTAAGLLAVRRLAADPGPAGRAAAAVGAVALAGGVLGPFIVDVLQNSGSGAGYYLGPAAVVALCALGALVVVCGTLAVHSTETVLLRRRQMAGLVASGMEPGLISDSQRIEALMATVPLATVGATLGGLGFGLLSGPGVLAAPVSVAVTVAAVFAAASWTTRLMRPWVADAVRPVNLRTE